MKVMSWKIIGLYLWSFSLYSPWWLMNVGEKSEKQGLKPPTLSVDGEKSEKFDFRQPIF